MQATLTDNPTKAEELAHWRAFLATLPEGSYLANYLEDSAGQLERAMADDMHIDAISEIRRRRNDAVFEQAEANQATTKAKDELASLNRQVSAQRRDLIALQTELRKTKEAAQTLARCALEAYEKASR